MSGSPRDERGDRLEGRLADQLEDQVERTLLSWRRTALSLVAASLLVGQVAGQRVGGTALAAALLGTSAVVGFVWLGRGQRIAAAGLALSAGVVLLGGVALVGVTAR